MNATIDFLNTVVKGHWLACTCDVLEIPNLSANVAIPPELKKATAAEQLGFIMRISEQIVERLTLVDSSFLSGEIHDKGDTVYNYARILCHYGSLAMEFRDAWAEGDGNRVLRCWKLFMPHFLASGCTKYSLQALRLQFQVHCVLPPNVAHQIMWNRFLNIRGGIGRNIPCDLFNEHMNKLIKNIIKNMGPNLTEYSLQKAARSVSPLHSICEKFDKESSVPCITTAHSTTPDTSDVKKTVAIVREHQLITEVPLRKHKSFPKLHLNPLNTWDVKKTQTWIRGKKKDYFKFKGKFRTEYNSDSENES